MAKKKPAVRHVMPGERCAVLDKNGVQCRGKATGVELYLGDVEIYGAFRVPDLGWVRAAMCAVHPSAKGRPVAMTEQTPDAPGKVDALQPTGMSQSAKLTQLQRELDAPGGERAQDEPTYAELARELALVREAAMDETLSDGAARAVARGTRPPTPTDIAWAEGEIAVLAATPRPAEPEQPKRIYRDLSTEENREYWRSVDALAAEAVQHRVVMPKPPKAGQEPPCRVPPAGWYCTRGAGHDGPCAARSWTDGNEQAWEDLAADGGLPESQPPKAEQEPIIQCPSCGCAGGNVVDRAKGLTLRCQYCGWPEKADTGTLETAVREWIDATDTRRALNEMDGEAPIALLKPANKRVKAAESALRALVARSENTPVFASKSDAVVERMEQEISLQDRLDETSRIAVLLRDALTELRRLQWQRDSEQAKLSATLTGTGEQK